MTTAHMSHSAGRWRCRLRRRRANAAVVKGMQMRERGNGEDVITPTCRYTNRVTQFYFEPGIFPPVLLRLVAGLLFIQMSLMASSQRTSHSYVSAFVSAATCDSAGTRP